MRHPGPVPDTAAAEPRVANPEAQNSVVPNSAEPNAGNLEQAAQGPILEPASAAESPAPNPTATISAKAHGRKTLSTAFVRVGPDGHLTVELRDGRAVVLRDVAMRPEKYCGVHVLGGPSGTRFCGRYADVAAAWPGGAPTFDGPASAAPNPLGPERPSSEVR